jgi:hypothetical protein
MNQKENKFRKTFEKMEGFSFVTPVTGLNRPITGKEVDDDDTLTSGADKQAQWLPVPAPNTPGFGHLSHCSLTTTCGMPTTLQ